MLIISGIHIHTHSHAKTINSQFDYICVFRLQNKIQNERHQASRKCYSEFRECVYMLYLKLELSWCLEIMTDKQELVIRTYKISLEFRIDDEYQKPYEV